MPEYTNKQKSYAYEDMQWEDADISWNDSYPETWDSILNEAGGTEYTNKTKNT